MTSDAIAKNQLLMAQTIQTLAHHIEHSIGFQITPVLVADLPMSPKTGMIACVTDGNPSGGSIQWGDTGVGGGTETLLIWYNGTHWTVIGK